MSAATAILKAKLRLSAHMIGSVRTESRLKVGVLTVSAVGLWFLAFYLFIAAFRWLRGFGVDPSGDAMSIGDVILLRMISVFSLALFFMLIFSNVLIAFSTLYRSREVAFLVSAPVSWREFFLVRFAECVVFSSWALAYLGSPLVLAYGIATGASWSLYAAALLFYPPFVTLPAAVGAIIAVVLVWLVPRLPRGTLILATIVILVIVFFYARAKLNATQLSEDTIVPVILDVTGRTQSPLVPSHWLTQGVLMAAEGDLAGAAFRWLLLMSNALFFTWLAAEAAARLFYRGWSAMQGMEGRRKGAGVLLNAVEWAARWLPEPLRSLTVKDFRVFWRDPAQWSQFVIFFGVMAVYVANLRNRGATDAGALYRNWVICLNIGACTLILATLTSRFVFPLMSLEGRRIWILGLAPLTFRQIIWQKFWLSVATTSVFTVTLTILSSVKLQLEPVHFFLSVYSIVIANFGLSGLAVGLGALYPNFNEDNPARIVSGMGGTLNFLLSFAYIVVIVGAQTVVLQWHVLEKFARTQTFWYALAGALAVITIASVITTFVPMRLGLRNLNLSEF